MNWETYSKYPIVILAGLLVSLLLTPWWARFATRIGMLDQPGGRKIHRQPVPRGGGVAVFAGFHAVCAIVFLFPWQPFAGGILINWWYKMLGLSGAVVLIGLYDDRFGLRAPVKLMLQLIVAAAAYVLDIRMQNILGVELPLWADIVATILWFLVLMNAFNLIDGIDGLAAGIAMIASAGIGISMIFRSAPGDVLLFMGLAGVCLGFLRYNFYPASVFLGDTGSLFLGFTLGALALSTNSKGPALAGIGMPLLAVGVPVFDVALAVWRRSIRRFLRDRTDAGGGRIAEADTDHIHHRLLGRVQTHSHVALILYGITLLLTVAGAFASIFHDRALGILALTFLVAAYTVMRHLAWIELRDSGRVVLQGISRPVRRNRTLLYYIAIDLIILNAAMIAAHYLMDMQNEHAHQSFKKFWLSAFPVDVVIPFLMLMLFRSYTRVWYLARISEYIMAGLAVFLGCAAAFALQLLYRNPQENVIDMFIYYILLAGISVPFVVGVRSAVRLIQDVMSWKTRGATGSRKRVLVYGAGYRATLFLRQVSFHESQAAPVLDVVGFADNDEAIRGHYVHGLRVLGSAKEIPALVRKFNIDCVYLIETLTEDEIVNLRAALANSQVKLIRWSTHEQVLA